MDKAQTKTSKGTAVIKRLGKFVPPKSLITIYKAFIRRHVDYAYILQDQPNNANFCQKIESVKYQVALAITDAIQGASQEKRLDESGLETHKRRRWLKRFCCMYKIINIGIPKYLTDVIPTHEIDYNIRNGTKTLLTAELKVLKIHFFPYTIETQYILDRQL